MKTYTVTNKKTKETETIKAKNEIDLLQKMIGGRNITDTDIAFFKKTYEYTVNESSLEEAEMKYQALAMAKDLHSQLAELTFIEMLSVMDPKNPAKKEVQELETELNDLTTKVGEFIQKYIPDVADGEAGDDSEVKDEDTNKETKTNEDSMVSRSFRDYLNESKDLEYRNIEQHMAKADYNVVGIKMKKNFGEETHYVEINNLPTNKQNLVPEEEFTKAQKHLDKLGLGKNYLVHTKQTISTKAGGRFSGKSSIND